MRQPFEVAVTRYLQEELADSHTKGATRATEATEAEELF